MNIETTHGLEEFDIDCRIIRWIMKRAGNPRISIRLCNGDDFWVTEERPVACTEFRSRRALLDVVLSPSVGFGECYSDELIEIHGDFLAFVNEITAAATRKANGQYYGPKVGSMLYAMLGTSLARGKTSITITISATNSINCGWTSAWFRPVRTSTHLAHRWPRRSSPNSSMYVGN